MDTWNDRYVAGSLPWDTGRPCPHLLDALRAGLVVGRVLEVGCGTGTNAVLLAQRGFKVVAVDLSPRAIELAREKARAAGVDVDFRVHDMLAGPVEGGPFAFVYDRGVWHVFDDGAARARFAGHVAAALAETGRWLSIAGSTEGPARETGPPRRSARDIAEAIEPHLEVLDLARTAFSDEGEGPGAAASWRILSGRRSVPAQPSTFRG